MKKTLLFLLAFVVINIKVTVDSEKILAVAFVSTKSHKITYIPLLHELARRGHNVTVLSPIPTKDKVQNVREILTQDFEPEFQKLMPNMFGMKESGKTLSILGLLDTFANMCKVTYDLPQVRELMKEKFDLLIIQPFFNDCVMGLVHHFNTSFIFVLPTQVPPMITTFTGLPSFPSFIPNVMSALTDKMTFSERMFNFFSNVVMDAGLEWYWKPTMEAIYREKLGNPNLPGINEVMSNVSLILSNSHFALSKPHPHFPDIVSVGGMHCRPAKPLPKDLDEFLNSSGEDGFIYFSMGSAIQAHTMPEKYRLMFINTFAKLKQKVLWKWETEEMADLPKNVKLGKWLPQQDILGHPKIRLFITHGGFGGTTEAVYHGVPLLGIPMAGDQSLNMQQSEKAGFAIKIEFSELSEETLLEGVNKIIGDKTYHERVHGLSKVFRDQADKPVERAAFWTEYVMRHKGAVHMRSAARDLNFFQLHSLDVIATFLGIILLVVYVVFAIIRFIFRKMCGTSKKHSNSAKKRN